MSYLKMPRPVPTLKGEIVTLRAIDPVADAQDYYDMFLEPELHLYTSNHVFDSVDEACEDLQKLADMDDATYWAIQDNASGKMMGRFVAKLSRHPELGLVASEGSRIAKPFWRKGHNRESRRLVFDYIFDVLGADRIRSQCWTENTNSRLSILAHGFTLTHETTQYNPKYDREMSASYFVLTRDEWLQHKEKHI